MGSKTSKGKIVVPPAKGYTCEKVTLDDAFKFILGVEDDSWSIDYSESGMYEGVKFIHVHMKID